MSTMNGIAAPAVVAAIVSGAILLVSHWISARRDAQSRRRELFAKALAASIDYREFAYAVRRRRHDQPEAERVRLSEAMRDVQGDIAFYAAWIRIESPVVAEAYRRLEHETRRVAGGFIRQAWEAKPITSDREMNVSGGLDFNTLAQLEDDYIEAVRRHLSPWRLPREGADSRQKRRRRPR